MIDGLELDCNGLIHGQPKYANYNTITIVYKRDCPNEAKGLFWRSEDHQDEGIEMIERVAVRPSASISGKTITLLLAGVANDTNS